MKVHHYYKSVLPKLFKAEAITFGKRIYYIKPESEVSDTLRKHEMAHVAQYRELGFIRFLYRYLKEYFYYRRKGLKHFDAYYQISFEKEARKHERM